MTKSGDADLWVRSVIRAVGDDLRTFLGVTKLERDLIATLYIKLRDTLETWDGRCPRELVEQSTLTVYFTAAAWAPVGSRSADVLPSLKNIIATTVTIPADGDVVQERNDSRKEGMNS